MQKLSLRTIAREWAWLGVIGFGGPPAHVRLLHDLCVTRNKWIEEREFEDAIAVTNLLPGPASTQLSIWCAARLAGLRGGIVGGLGFVLPGLLLIILPIAFFVGAMFALSRVTLSVSFAALITFPGVTDTFGPKEPRMPLPSMFDPASLIPSRMMRAISGLFPAFCAILRASDGLRPLRTRKFSNMATS